MNKNIAALYRAEFGRLVATVTRMSGDIALAEDIAQEAFIKAHRQWPDGEIPEHAGAWLMKTAKHQTIDVLRRAQRWQEKSLSLNEAEPSCDIDAPDESALMNDDMARLIFTCCHPALNIEARVALCLNIVCGLRTEEVARAFILKEASMSQRLWRAKKKIRDAGIGFSVPEQDALAVRLDAVLTVIYLIFNEGWLASGDSAAIRHELVNEALRLCELLSQNFTDEPKILSLLAFMRLQHSRRDARFTKDGRLIRLADQNRELWRQDEIESAVNMLHGVFQAGAGRERYALMAAIASEHARASSPATTNWNEIVILYDVLVELDPSPVLALNRAVALAERDGAQAGLQEMDALAEALSLQRYHLFHASRAEMLRRLGQNGAAKQAYAEALTFCPGATEKRFLLDRMDET